MNTRLTLTIDSGDAAMADADGALHECARLLRRVASLVESGHEGGQLHDYNGNRCGEWSAEYPEPEDDEDDTEECSECGETIDGRNHDGMCADCAADNE